MNIQAIAQRLYDSRFRSTAFALFGGVIIYADQSGVEVMKQVQPWVKQFAALAMLGFGLMSIVGFVAGSFLKIDRS